LSHGASVIVPSLTGDRLSLLLDSLAEQTIAHQVIVVDNGCPDGSVERACERHPGVERLRFERNLGFSRAVNAGATRAEGDVLVMVNDDVVYVAEAESWTETPATVRGFLRQQRRWKRGFIRESIYTLSYAWRVKKLLWLQILLWDLSAPFLAFGLRIGLVVLVVTNPALFVTAILPGWLVLLLIRYIFVPLRARDKLLGLFLYMFFYEGILYWLNLWALFTVRNKSWVTRTTTAQA